MALEPSRKLAFGADAREGWDFEFAPERVTMYPQDFVVRQERMAGYAD